MDATPELVEVLGGNKVRFQRFSTYTVSTDERKLFYSRDETFEAIQRRFDLKTEAYCPEKQVRMSMLVLIFHPGQVYL